MSQEKKFHRVLLDLMSVGVFNIVDINFLLLHPYYPSAYIEVDNIAQKKDILFVFEAKSKDIGKALTQLRDRYKSLILFKYFYMRKRNLLNYNRIRLFYYNLKNHTFIEVDYKGRIVSTYKFSDLNELKNIIRKV